MNADAQATSGNLPDVDEDIRQLLFASHLDDAQVDAILSPYRLVDFFHADQTIQALAGAPAMRELFANILPIILKELSQQPDPLMSLDYFEKFVVHAGNRMVLYRQLKNNPFLIRALITIFGHSRFLADILIRYPRDLGILSGKTAGDPRPRMWVALADEMRAVSEYSHRLAALRRFKARQMLRIGALDLVHGEPIEVVTDRISAVAEIALEEALVMARRLVRDQYGELGDGRSGLAVIAFGKLGGCELNYSSDIDLMFVYDAKDVSDTTGGSKGKLDADRFFTRIGQETIKIISEVTPEGYVFRTDLRLRPYGNKGPLANSLASTLKYYYTFAKTWERQAMIKARHVAGDWQLGKRLMDELQSFIYKKYLSQSAVQEIKSVKTRIEFEAYKRGEEMMGVKLGKGGIRDVEFLVQFLQMLHGGHEPAIRTSNTLGAINALVTHGCLDPGHGRILEHAYRFLRVTEHRLQLYEQLKIHSLPAAEDEQERLARMMGFTPSTLHKTARQIYLRIYRSHKEAVRALFEKLFVAVCEDHGSHELHEVVFDPDLDEARARELLAPYGFQDARRAYHILQSLSDPAGSFHWEQRTRHGFVRIVPVFLDEVAETPDPDRTINNLEQCLGALGAKAVFYELLNENKDAMRLLVQVCGMSDYLSSILMKNPELIDEIMDHLGTCTVKDRSRLAEELEGLITHMEKPLKGVFAFHKAEILRIGVVDVLGRVTFTETTRVLSELAEVILDCVYRMCFDTLIKTHGRPSVAEDGSEAEMVVLAAGKFGGGEMNYHSDLDVIFVYSHDGVTEKGLSHHEFFNKLAVEVLNILGRVGPDGYLYKVDARLRPGGKKNPLASAFSGFRSYYMDGAAEMWERMALVKARPVIGGEAFSGRVMEVVRAFTYEPKWSSEMVERMLEMRRKLEASVARKKNIKRGRGGIVDVEFLVQLFQLRHGKAHPSLQVLNTSAALYQLQRLGFLKWRMYQTLLGGYEFLRMIENRLRIASNLAHDTFPDDPHEMDVLARRLHYRSTARKRAGENLWDEYHYTREQIRACFEEITKENLEEHPE